MKNLTVRILPALRLALVFLGLAAPALSHELWLDAQDYSVAAGDELRVDIRNGQEFKGLNLAYLDNRIVTFDLMFDGVRVPVQARNGDQPALQLRTGQDGLLTLIYESTPSTVDYDTWDEFAAFAAHKDFPEAEARHKARGLPMDGFSEVYNRYTKALIGVGTGAGVDGATGLLTEFVALDNPYTDPLPEGMGVRLLYRGAPRADAQIEVFERAPDGSVAITTQRTDARGEARIAVRPGHDYLLDAVILREPDAEDAGDTGAVWQTLWAALTFGVPG